VDFLDVLKKIEPNVSQIARDAGLKRQAVYLWKDGGMPRQVVFDRLLATDKYKAELITLNYESLRDASPLGRPTGSKNKSNT